MCRRRFNIRKYFTVIHNINKLKESKTTWSSHLMLKISSAKSSNPSKIVLFEQKFFRKRCTLTNWGDIAGNGAWRRFDQVIPLSSNFTWSLKYIVMFSDLGWCCRYCNTEKEKKRRTREREHPLNVRPEDLNSFTSHHLRFFRTTSHSSLIDLIAMTSTDTCIHLCIIPPSTLT